MKAKTYGVFSTKGGAGKSTSSANVGGILADMGQRTLLIDCDGQQSLSRWYTITERAEHGLTQMVRSANPAGCISKTNIKNLDIVLNDDPHKDSIVAQFIRESFYHALHIKNAVDAVADQYDYVIIDTQGAKGILQEAVLFASDVVLSPVQPNGLDAKEFITNTLQAYKVLIPKQGMPSLTGRPPAPLRVLINMADRTVMTQQISASLRKQFDQEAGHLVSVLDCQIPDLSAYKEAAAARTPVHRYEKSRSGPTLSALHIMKKLVHELEPRLIDHSPVWSK